MSQNDVPAIGDGDVIVTIAGEDYVLKPTPRAALAISREQGGGGLATAKQKVLVEDFDTIVLVICQGVGLMPRYQKEMPAKVFETGLAELKGPVFKYLDHLSHGGRPPRIPEDEAEDEDGDDPLAVSASA